MTAVIKTEKLTKYYGKHRGMKLLSVKRFFIVCLAGAMDDVLKP